MTKENMARETEVLSAFSDGSSSRNSCGRSPPITPIPQVVKSVMKMS